MKRSHCLQTYVTAQVDNWIKACARELEASSSVVVRDCIHDAWLRKTGAESRTPCTVPVRQIVWITVALDALLAHHEEATLRDRTVAACHRRLVPLGLASPCPEGGEHGE